MEQGAEHTEHKGADTGKPPVPHPAWGHNGQVGCMGKGAKPRGKESCCCSTTSNASHCQSLK